MARRSRLKKKSEVNVRGKQCQPSFGPLFLHLLFLDTYLTNGLTCAMDEIDSLQWGG